MCEEKKLDTIKPEDLFRFKFLQEGQISPDGKTVAYTVTHVDAEKDAEYVTIWLLSLETGESRQFTTGLTSDMNPRWSPDGEQIVFFSVRGEKPQIYLIPASGGEARALTAMPQGVGGGAGLVAGWAAHCLYCRASRAAARSEPALPRHAPHLPPRRHGLCGQCHAGYLHRPRRGWQTHTTDPR